MLWFLRMIIETPRAIYEYRQDYFKRKEVRKTIKKEGLVAGFYKHHEMFGCTISEWVELCDYINDMGEEVPQGLIDFALDMGWLSMNADYIDEESTNSSEEETPDWETWENA